MFSLHAGAGFSAPKRHRPDGFASAVILMLSAARFVDCASDPAAHICGPAESTSACRTGGYDDSAGPPVAHSAYGARILTPSLSICVVAVAAPSV